MGQKVNPYGFRLGYIKGWKSIWYAEKKEFAGLLHEDIKIRKFIFKRLAQASIPTIDICRKTDKVRIIIHSARPGIIIGRRGSEIDKLKDELSKFTDKEILIDIKEIKNPSIDAQLVADNIAFQLVKRIAHKRAMKKTMTQAMMSGAKGIKIACAGRLGGAEIARTEAYKEGSVPLQTLRADIDYGFTEATTTYGQIGVKVWIYKGDILPERKGERNGVDAKASKV